MMEYAEGGSLYNGEYQLYLLLAGRLKHLESF